VRYSRIQRDTGRQIRTDTAGYSATVGDTAEYSGSAAKWLDIDRYMDTAGDTYQG